LSNEHYLIVSYFVVALVSICLGIAVYRVLRAPFAAIAEATVGRGRSQVLKRLLATSMTIAAMLGFLSVSYTQKSCTTMSYDQVVKDRNYLVETNQEQLRKASDWVVVAVFLWCAVVLVCVATLRKTESGSSQTSIRG